MVCLSISSTLYKVNLVSVLYLTKIWNCTSLQDAVKGDASHVSVEKYIADQSFSSWAIFRPQYMIGSGNNKDCEEWFFDRMFTASLMFSNSYFLFKHFLRGLFLLNEHKFLPAWIYVKIIIDARNRTTVHKVVNISVFILTYAYGCHAQTP